MSKEANQIPPVGERWKWFEDRLIRGIVNSILNNAKLDLTHMHYDDDGKSTIDINLGPTTLQIAVSATVTRDDRTDEQRAADQEWSEQNGE